MLTMRGDGAMPYKGTEDNGRVWFTDARGWDEVWRLAEKRRPDTERIENIETREVMTYTEWKFG